ncbi:MAG TPA: hypothetical protein VF623_01960 [Segetibacter sp.]|jgi:uncharacterized protein YjgD (DUF1641 family)
MRAYNGYLNLQASKKQELADFISKHYTTIQQLERLQKEVRELGELAAKVLINEVEDIANEKK